MKRWHHLEWYRFRKYGSPDRRRRRDRFHSLELVLGVDPAGTTLVDLLDGRFMGQPSLMEVTSGNAVSSKVVVVLTTYSCHRFLETGQFVLQVLHGVMKDVQLGRLHLDHLPEVIGLKTRLGLYRKLIYNQDSYLGLLLSEHPPKTVNHVQVGPSLERSYVGGVFSQSSLTLLRNGVEEIFHRMG